jgi:hypothetical protein
VKVRQPETVHASTTTRTIMPKAKATPRPSPEAQKTTQRRNTTSSLGTQRRTQEEQDVLCRKAISLKDQKANCIFIHTSP